MTRLQKLGAPSALKVVHLIGMPREVKGAYLLADKTLTALKVTKVGTGIEINLPAEPLDPIATVLILETV